MNRTLLISDLDDTLLGNDAALERFARYREGRAEDLTLVYATGRFFETVEDDVRNTPLPAPAAIIGGVGSEMRAYPSGEPYASWIERMSRGWSADAVRDALQNESDLEPQPESAQSPFKVSYFLRDADRSRLGALRETLAEQGLDARLVYSSGRDLDVLPSKVDKGHAARHMAGALGFSEDEVVVAGNSANDAALFEHGFRGIVVANAHDELKALTRSARAYLANQGYADGVREGLEHWRVRRD